jgi:RNA polymerase sigma-70 factor (ECF subfamily)
MAAYYSRRTGEDPDDLLQEACCGLLDALRELDISIGSPEQYLLKRARWRMLDAVKRARIRRCLPLDEETDHRSDCPIEGVLAKAHVSAFADQLNTSQRDILAALLSGLTWREVGDALGCTSANVAYHVRQIRQRYVRWIEDAGTARTIPGSSAEETFSITTCWSDIENEASSILRLKEEVGELINGTPAPGAGLR